MSSHIFQVTPKNIARAKRIAKRLKELYPQHALSVCQATTAHLLGHKDWYALEKAVKSGNSPGPFDHDLDDGELELRSNDQRAIICMELGGVDPSVDHSRPPRPGSKSILTETELAAHAMAMEEQAPKRLERAYERWDVLYASEAYLEILPTAEEMPVSQTYSQFMSHWSPEQIQALPKKIGEWWMTNVPYQPEVGQALLSFELNPHSLTSLLWFGRYWGTLSIHYAQVIDWTMAMGTAFVLADRFGSICGQDSQELRDFLAKGKKLSSAEVDAGMESVFNASMVSVTRYLDAYPRDDFRPVFEAQPEAFLDNAKKAMKILSTPGSKKGTWEASSGRARR